VRKNGPSPANTGQRLRPSIEIVAGLPCIASLAKSHRRSSSSSSPRAAPARNKQYSRAERWRQRKDSFLLTIFFKHHQGKSLDQINAQLQAQGFYKAFPPPGIEVVSWYVMMGIGQVPAERLREVNRAIEQTAWGGYRTEFYPTYDYKEIGEDLRAKARTQ
jgi:hypothetical protein